jgi:transcriptional regulator with PAS, ATPase and Fis domain
MGGDYPTNTLKIHALGGTKNSETSSLKELSRKFELDVVRSVLKESGSQSIASQKLGISVRTLQRLLNLEDEQIPEVENIQCS